MAFDNVVGICWLSTFPSPTIANQVEHARSLLPIEVEEREMAEGDCS